MSHQLPLGFTFSDDVSFETFYVGSNSLLLKQLLASVHERSEPLIYMWGSRGVGKTHLLQAACQYVAKQAQSIAFVPLREHQRLSPEMFQGLEHLKLVCIDDVEAIKGHSAWEEALFHLYNRARETHLPILMSGKVAPAQLGLSLQDLVSRLGWGLVFHLQELNDEEKLGAIQQRAKFRGMVLSDDVGRYLLKRYSRETHALFQLLDQLDKASLTAQRKLTIPFVRRFVQRDSSRTGS
ncbi:MAG: DnaA regulatory inactivator Hda [Gammaproteobacteria bacterium]|nr:DnaA regulatory inactivator Hda [Gammaproteobacteria bacterium]